MRKIIRLLRDHVRQDFHPWLYAYTFLFLVITISINYYLDFEDSILDTHFGTWKGVVYNILFFMVPFYGIAIPQALFKKNKARLSSLSFWSSSFALIALVGLVSGFYGHVFFAITFTSYTDRLFAYRVGDFMKPIILFVPLAIYLLVKYGKLGVFYGLNFKRFDHRPYALMLLGMVPLIAAASFFGDFQETYPRYKPWQSESAFGLSFWQMGLLYELSYGINLLFTEFMFRGMLVIGLAKVLGKDTILPMVAAYAFLHFGKPLFETIGSIFGGYILGVIALNSRSILGGIWVHMGVAWLMELAAYFQHAKNGFD